MDKVYILHDCDDWTERNLISGVFGTREGAIAYIKEHYPEFYYYARYDRWRTDEYSGYFWIEECEVLS